MKANYVVCVCYFSLWAFEIEYFYASQNERKFAKENFTLDII